MRIEFIPEKVLRVVRQRGYREEAIVEMSAKRLFAIYAEWNGVPMPENLFELVVELEGARIASLAADRADKDKPN